MFTNTLSLLALVGAAQAHMSMYYPAPLGGHPSINKFSTVRDKEFNYPLGCCGPSGGSSKPSPGLCRGHLDKFDTEQAQVTWQAGQETHFSLTDFNYDEGAPGSTHSGGSCQVGFSVDKGKTWKVAASYHGACPKPGGGGSPEEQTFDFKVPTGMPEGDALFAWVWLNREHESFMNCAKVRIGSGSGSTPAQPAKPAQSSSAAQVPSASQSPQKPPQSPPQSPTKPQQPTQSLTTPQWPTRSPVYSSRPSPMPGRPEGSEDDDDEDDEEYNHGDHHHHEHRAVEQGARRSIVDGASCVCRPGGEVTTRCSCDAPAEKRAALEKKALRMHRRNNYKRVDACDWASAPAMEVSYFTSDAKCAPNAKTNTPSSDAFELKWDVSCGAVEGQSEYNLKTMTCDMYG